MPQAKFATDKREAIMGAALELFVERGFYGVAVPEIADRAGVGAGTIYRYFESKEALVNAIYREQKLSFGAVTISDFPVDAPTRDQFHTMWNRMASFAIERPEAFIFLELHHHAAYLDDESRKVEQRMLELTSDVIRAAQARHDLKAGEPKLLMSIVMGAFTGIMRGCVESAAAKPPTMDEWRFAERCVWEAIRG
ncbi:MAG TPA: TetR/AcrR family transcriptional regulator [Kofleriaceae bacterium]